MWNILKDENELDNASKQDFNHTLNKSFTTTRTFNTVIIYASNLKEENKKYLNEIASKNKIKIVSTFQYVIDVFLAH
mgnify:CR=1 FL=1